MLSVTLVLPAVSEVLHHSSETFRYQEKAYDVYEDEYMFEDGKLAINCTMGSYIAIKDHKGNFYYAEGETNATGDQVTLKWAYGWSPCQKWALLEGMRYIIIRSAKCKGDIKLESVSKEVFDAYHYGAGQAVQQVETKRKPASRLLTVSCVSFAATRCMTLREENFNERN